MVALQLDDSTLINRTQDDLYLSLTPAPPLPIPPNKEVSKYSSTIEHIFLHHPGSENEECYAFAGDLSLGPGSLAAVVASGPQVFLQYQPQGDQGRYMMPLHKVSDGHKLHLEVMDEPLNGQDIVPDESTARSLGTTMLFVQDEDQKAPGAFILRLAPPISGGSVDYELEESDKRLNLIQQMIQAYTVGQINAAGRQRGRAIDPITEVELHMKTTASAFYKAVFHSALAPVLLVKGRTAVKFDQTCNRADVHPNFINTFAKDLKIEPDEYEKLDRTLNEHVRRITSAKGQISQSVNFTLMAKQSLAEKKPGRTNPIVTGYLKFFYISTAANTWTEVVKRGKSSSSVEKIRLTFEYIPCTCTVDPDGYARMEQKYKDRMDAFADSGLDDFFAETDFTLMP